MCGAEVIFMFWIIVVNSWIPSYKGWAWAKPADCRDFLMCVLPPELSKCIITHFSNIDISSSGLCRCGLWRNLEMGRWESPWAAGSLGQRLLWERQWLSCAFLCTASLGPLGVAACQSIPQALLLQSKGEKNVCVWGNNWGSDLGAGREEKELRS